MLSKNNDIFERIEKKYIMNQTVYKIFWKKIQDYMVIDQYGLGTICNVYYDTPQYDLIRHSIEKPPYKEKLRIRSYGIPQENTPIYVELKKKWNGVVYKRRIEMSMHETREYLESGKKPTIASQIQREIDYFLHFYQPVPKIYIAYDRIAMYGKEDENLRLTLDFHIRTRDYDLDLTRGDYGDLLMEEGQVLMEIKVGGAYPLWLTRLLNELKIYPISFSKYGTIYKKKLQENSIR